MLPNLVAPRSIAGSVQTVPLPDPPARRRCAVCGHIEDVDAEDTLTACERDALASA